MTALCSTFTSGLGSLRFDPRTTSPEDIKRLAKVLLEHPSIGMVLRGPIKYYVRGETDARLEYDFKIPNNEELADNFYQKVRLVTMQTIHIVGKWHHSHWTGVEYIS